MYVGVPMRSIRTIPLTIVVVFNVKFVMEVMLSCGKKLVKVIYRLSLFVGYWCLY